MTNFYFYTICNSEHTMVVVGYSPTSSQQVDAIFWNITITVLYYIFIVLLIILFLCLKLLHQKNTETHYPVIILLYWARASEP